MDCIISSSEKCHHVTNMTTASWELLQCLSRTRCSTSSSSDLQCSGRRACLIIDLLVCLIALFMALMTIYYYSPPTQTAVKQPGAINNAKTLNRSSGSRIFSRLFATGLELLLEPMVWLLLPLRWTWTPANITTVGDRIYTASLSGGWSQHIGR